MTRPWTTARLSKGRCSRWFRIEAGSRGNELLDANLEEELSALSQMQGTRRCWTRSLRGHITGARARPSTGALRRSSPGSSTSCLSGRVEPGERWSRAIEQVGAVGSGRFERGGDGWEKGCGEDQRVRPGGGSSRTRRYGSRCMTELRGGIGLTRTLMSRGGMGTSGGSSSPRP